MCSLIPYQVCLLILHSNKEACSICMHVNIYALYIDVIYVSYNGYFSDKFEMCNMFQHINTHVITSIPGAGGSVSFWFRDTVYQNNSLVTLEDIGEGDDDALLCITDLTACCRPPYSGTVGPVIGNWFFPNGTRIGEQWEMYRTRGQSVVRLHRKRGGQGG